MKRFDPQRLDKRSARSWRYTAFSLLLTVFLVIQPILLPGWGINFEGDVYLLSIGGVVCLGGLGLNRWGRTYLGKYFVESTEIQEDHILINTGPYRYIRHPIYSSLMTIATGLLLVNPSIWMGLATIYAYIDFSLAARRDEKLLSEELPGYAQYMTQTPRFFPKWTKPSA
jgi:protein-S-isoprenylcysteine O-methyltransferase Ste14